MTPSNRVFAGLVAAAILAALAPPGLAQPPQATPPAAGQQQAWRRFVEHRIHQRVEMGARRLHDILNLRPEQDAALNTLVAALTPAPGALGRAGGHGDADMTGLSTPERLDRLSARGTERLADFQRKAAAIKVFYAQLSPDQKRTFDALWPDRSEARRALWVGAYLGFVAGHAAGER